MAKTEVTTFHDPEGFTEIRARIYDSDIEEVHLNAGQQQMMSLATQEGQPLSVVFAAMSMLAFKIEQKEGIKPVDVFNLPDIRDEPA